VSLDPLKGDANAWSTDAARGGDYGFIRHERYSPGVVTERLDVLAKLIEYLKQHSLSGDPGFAHVDLSHIAIAGFDVGAYTAMILAGENAENVSPPGLSLHPDAVIALSPYAGFSGSNFEVRYQRIKMPVLSVTGDADSDTHGSDLASLHQAPFQYMPPGDKYLLLLSRASHADIG
jgi:predicted dienelactone hydrolase